MARCAYVFLNVIVKAVPAGGGPETSTLLNPTIVPSAAWTVSAVASKGRATVVPTGNGAAVVRVNVPPVGLPTTETDCTAELMALG